MNDHHLPMVGRMLAVPLRWLGVSTIIVAACAVRAAGGHPVAPTSVTCTLSISREIQGGSPVTLEFRGTFADGAGRLDIVGGTDAGSFPPGAFHLLADTAGAAWIVVPSQKAYVRMTSGAALGGIVDPFPTSGSVTDVAVTLDSLGPGEIIDQQPTQRYRITTEFHIKQGTTVSTNRAVTELWQAEVPGKILNPFLGLEGNGMPRNRFRELDDKLSAVHAHLPGTTIRSATIEVLSAGAVAITHTRVTTRLSNIRAAQVDKAMLAIPAGYTLRQ